MIFEGEKNTQQKTMQEFLRDHEELQLKEPNTSRADYDANKSILSNKMRYSTSRFLQNESDDEDKISSISELFIT